MNLLRDLQLRFRALFQKQKLDAQMDDEMRSHIEMQTQENIDAGMRPDEARYAALRQFGWVESIKETCRDQRGVSWIENLAQDIHYGVRILGKNRGFTTVAVLTLALGIGANTAIFSVANGVLLRPLPSPESERLFMVFERSAHWPKFQVTPPTFVDWRTQNTVFEEMAAQVYGDFNLTGSDTPERLLGVRVSGGIFKVLRVQPKLGRPFGTAEDLHGRHHVVVLSDSLWKRRFGADPGVVGGGITLNGTSYTVLGMMPKGFHYPSAEVELWTPMAFTPDELNSRGSHTVDDRALEAWRDNGTGRSGDADHCSPARAAISRKQQRLERDPASIA